jgi:hypothetical protein
MTRSDLEAVRSLICGTPEASRRIDDLNVYPVPNQRT